MSPLPKDFARTRSLSDKKKLRQKHQELYIGLFIGSLFVGILWWFQKHTAHQHLTPETIFNKKAKKDISPPQELQMEFDFYKLLPNLQPQTEPSPENVTESSPPSPLLTSPKPNTPTTEATIPITTTHPPLSHQQKPQKATRWWVQVGAFRQKEQADQIKVKLILAGFDPPQVRVFQKEQEALLYRVQWGPYTENTARLLQKKLLAHHFSPSLIPLPDPSN